MGRSNFTQQSGQAPRVECALLSHLSSAMSSMERARHNVNMSPGNEAGEACMSCASRLKEQAAEHNNLSVPVRPCCPAPRLAAFRTSPVSKTAPSTCTLLTVKPSERTSSIRRASGSIRLRSSGRLLSCKEQTCRCVLKH